MNEIFVLDTETTGLLGGPHDKVLDIGVTRVDLDERTVEDAFSSVVGYDVSKWNSELRNSWIFTHSDLTLDMVKEAESQADVSQKLHDLLDGRIVTSYNVEFDFGKFLLRSPWNLNKSQIPGDIMLCAAEYMKIPGYYGQWKWPKLEQAYDRLVPGDPAGIAKGQDHRALSDARVASYVLLALDRLGCWRQV